MTAYTIAIILGQIFADSIGGWPAAGVVEILGFCSGALYVALVFWAHSRWFGD